MIMTINNKNNNNNNNNNIINSSYDVNYFSILNLLTNFRNN